MTGKARVSEAPMRAGADSQFDITRGRRFIYDIAQSACYLKTNEQSARAFRGRNEPLPAAELGNRFNQHCRFQ
jgi:hypothetical protein